MTKVLTPYDITGKSGIGVCAVIWRRLYKLASAKSMSWDEAGIEQTFEIAGKDTLFHIVAGAYRIFVKEDIKAVSAYIEKEVHKLFVEQKGE